MLKSIINRLSSPKKNFQKSLNSFWSDFLSHPEHRWIAQNPIYKRLFYLFFDSFPSDVLDFFHSAHPIVFIQTKGRLAATINTSNGVPVVLIYPDLNKIMLSANPLRAVAILAHEIGHIYLNHTNRTISSLGAQVEADEFAYQLGWGSELLEVLSEYREVLSHHDCDERVIHLRKLLNL